MSDTLPYVATCDADMGRFEPLGPIGDRASVRVRGDTDPKVALMPKYLITANYTAEGMAGVRAAGAKSRVDAVRHTLEAMGGSLDSFHFAFGDTDVFVIVDAPDDEAVAAASIAINGSGAVRTSTTKLLTVEQIDEALRRTVDYQPPGS
jgi:uncharacterized protein with GYD domain